MCFYTCTFMINNAYCCMCVFVVLCVCKTQSNKNKQNRHTVVMIPATAYSKCYISYLFVAVILLSLTSLHMCVVVAAEEPLEENVVAELKQKAGEVEALAGDVKEANEKMVTSAREMVSLLTETIVKINEAKDEDKKKDDVWAATLEATNSAKESADKAVKVAEKIQTAANKAGGAMQKIAAKAKVILGDVKNINTLIGELKNETDTTVSLWGEVSNDDVQSLLDTTSAIVEKTNKAKEEVENVLEEATDLSDKNKDKQLNARPEGNGQENRAEAVLQSSQPSSPDLKQKGPENSATILTTSEKLQVHEKEAPDGEDANLRGDKAAQREALDSKALLRNTEHTKGAVGAGQPGLPGSTGQDLGDQVQAKAAQIKLLAPKKTMRLMQTEMAIEKKNAEEAAQHKSKETKNEVVKSLGDAAEEAMKLNEGVQSVKEKINNARQLSQEVAQLADKVIKMRESKESSVLPSSFGGLVFVVNNICLTIFVTLTYVFGNTL